MPATIVTYEDVMAAAKRIKPFIHRTPVMTCSAIDRLVGRKVYFKCENLQKTGSFKVRGALNAVLKLKENDPNHPGVATHSSGNHAMSLSFASSCAGLPASVIVPSSTPMVKREAVEGYGGTLHICEPNLTSRIQTCDEVCKKQGQVYISSHDNLDIIAGQGTIAMELLEDVPDLQAIFASASGGGMVAGISVGAKGIQPNIKVFAVEPRGKDLTTSLNQGKRLWPTPPRYIDTIADGIRVQPIGENCFSIFLKNVEREVFTVDNQQISEAMRLIWSRMKLVVETSAAATLAAVLSQQMKDLDPSITKVGVILCGGNVDLDKLPWQPGF